MKLKDFIEQLNKYDPETEIIFSDDGSYPNSFSRIGIGKLGIEDTQYIIDEFEEIEFDTNEPVKDVIIIKIDGGVF